MDTDRLIRENRIQADLFQERLRKGEIEVVGSVPWKPILHCHNCKQECERYNTVIGHWCDLCVYNNNPALGSRTQYQNLQVIDNRPVYFGNIQVTTTQEIEEFMRVENVLERLNKLYR